MRRRLSVSSAARDDGGHTLSSPLDELRQGVLDAIHHRLLTTIEEGRQDPVDDDRGRGDAGLGAEAVEELDALGDRHLLRCGDHHHPGARRVVEDLAHPRVWSRTRPTLTRSAITVGAEICPMMWPLASASTTTRS